MTWRNRETLKNYFADGELPTQAHFADLIDSMLNMVDEGFRKTVANGQEICAPVGHHHLLSFYRDQAPDQALWRVSLGPQQDQLQFQPPGDGSPVLSLDAAGASVGIGTAHPQATLDVRGPMSSQGRRGNLPLPGPVWANGEWQDLTGELVGCQGFEVVAGVGEPGTGHFGLVHAIALSTYNPGGGLLAWWRARRGIRLTQGWWSRRCDKLQLRWHGSHGRKASYRLQIRSGCHFGENVKIQAHVSQLWFDPHMAGSQPAVEPGP